MTLYLLRHSLCYSFSKIHNVILIGVILILKLTSKEKYTPYPGFL